MKVENTRKSKSVSPSAATVALLKEVARSCDVRNHADVSSWLLSVHEAMKKCTRPWSYLTFTQAAGLGESNWLAQVVVHKRRLTEASASRLAEALELPSAHAEALLALVRHAFARNPLRRQALWTEVEKSQEKRNKVMRGDERFQFLDEWHHVVVLESLTLFPAGASESELTGAIRYALGEGTVSRSLSLLCGMGLARRDEQTGLWTKAQANLDLGGSIPGSGVLRFHLRMIDLAKDALTHLPEGEREIAALTLSCPREFLPKLKRMLEEFQQYVMWLTQQTQGADTVYQLNLQLFPLTRERKRV